ncbi:hypothetical protein [Lentzea cavernae]|uniref:Uncharacterized protein n=1 Tax=Lentzea cavernae TaxID=2020703 RepID=A0ABQ3MXD0_9PSEU|nr:hypothetical protein [Lentzea cavernae]GHH57863.1 hypothetical protein GCM10017774_78280 [Lentzea cavernae]
MTNALVCTAQRLDGEPCWLRVHDSRVHLARDMRWFTLPDPKWTNVDLAGDELRDAPDALKSPDHHQASMSAFHSP